MKRKLNNDGQLFYQYQQNEQSPVIFTNEQSPVIFTNEQSPVIFTNEQLPVIFTNEQSPVIFTPWTQRKTTTSGWKSRSWVEIYFLSYGNNWCVEIQEFDMAVYSH